MKKVYLTLIIVVLTGSIFSQNYQYSLNYVGINGSTNNYQIALVATPDFEQITPAPTSDMGAAMYIPTGYTIGNFVAGNSGLQFFEWANSQENSYDGGVTDLVQLQRTDIIANDFTHTNGQPMELILFDIISDGGNGNNPTNGQIILAENTDINVTTNFYESFKNINLQDGNGTLDYFSGHDVSANSINFATLSTSEFGLSAINISAYPNPTKGSLNIYTNKAITYSIYNILGQSVKIAGELNANVQRTINLSQLPDGIYILKAQDDNKNSKSFKIIKKE